jgi:hypothetical protein
LSLYEHQIEHELVIWRPIDRLSTLRFQWARGRNIHDNASNNG